MRLFQALCVAVVVFLISSCSSDGEELIVGKYINEETIEFSEDKIIDQDQINIVKEVISSGEKLDGKEDFSRLPDLAIRIDDPGDSTMVLAMSIWFNDDGTATYYRGLNHIDEKELYIISEEETEKLRSVLP